MKNLRWRLQEVRRRLRRKISRRVILDRNQDPARCRIVSGTGRSGTTWLTELIASTVKGRVIFEPFNPRLLPAYASFNYFQYMRPDDADSDLERYCDRLFSGLYRHKWMDGHNDQIVASYRIVKSIRCSLFLRWIHAHFPEVSILFLMRHPCAVVLSRMTLNWATDGDLKPMMRQSDLIRDYLGDKADIIRQADAPEEKHALVWAIHNMVPLAQFRDISLDVIFYEHLATQPEKVLPTAFRSLDLPFRESVLAYADRPSATARPTSAVVKGADAITAWQTQLSGTQVDRILSIVKAFGLDDIYGSSPMPLLDGATVDSRSRSRLGQNVSPPDVEGIWR